MKRKTLMTYLAAALCTGGMSLAGSHTQTQPAEQPEGMGQMPTMEQMIAMIDDMAKPDTTSHELLKRLAGEWTMTARFVMDPAAPPEISTGKATSKWVLGGRQLMSTVEMDMVFMGERRDFSGMGVMGFDKATSTFVSTWMDTMGTGQLRQTGTMEGDTIVIVGEAVHPLMGAYTVKNVYKFVENGFDMEFWEKGEMINPEFMNTGVIEYRRPG